MRKNWDEYFMTIVDAVGERATCDRGRSGAIIVKDRKILTTGYVGSPPGMPHCDEVGHLMETVARNGVQGVSSHCVRTIHAEENAILQAAEFGISIKGGTLYCKMVPCFRCAMKIIRVGIVRVVAGKRYQTDERSIQMFADRGVELKVIEDVKEEY